MTRYRREETFEEFRDVKFGDFSKSGKAIKCTFSDGKERWVPLSQIEDGCDPQPGTKGALSVTEWIVEQWAEEDEGGGGKRGGDDRSQLVSIPNAIALRDTDRGLQVRVGDVTQWLAKSQVHDSSDVKLDGDNGVLVIPRWVAEEKGFAASTQGRTVADDVAEVFSSGRGGDDDIPF